MLAHSECLDASRWKMRLALRLLACGFLILAGQVALWFELGQWTPSDLAAVLIWFHTSLPLMHSQFAQGLLSWLLGFPLSGLMMACGAIVGWLGTAGGVASHATQRG
jgi:hypothetical protein